MHTCMIQSDYFFASWTEKKRNRNSNHVIRAQNQLQLKQMSFLNTSLSQNDATEFYAIELFCNECEFELSEHENKTAAFLYKQTTPSRTFISIHFYSINIAVVSSIIDSNFSYGKTRTLLACGMASESSSSTICGTWKEQLIVAY